MFIGQYKHSIDNKGRITVPSKFRSDLGAKFIITKGLDTCLFIYPTDEWNNIIDKYKSLPNTKNARGFLRILLSGANDVELDKQGRVNITQTLVDYANIKDDCILIGVNDHIEVWEEQAWNKFLNDNESNYSDIAEDLFMI